MNRYRVELRDDEDCSSVWYGNASIIESAIAKAKQQHRCIFGEFRSTVKKEPMFLKDLLAKAREFEFIKASKVD